MNVIKEDIEAAVEKELATATERFGLHHSLHEKYAVTLEELEEAASELRDCQSWIKNAWFDVKHNKFGHADGSFENLYRCAVKLACEAVQVAAMCRKEIKK